MKKKIIFGAFLLIPVILVIFYLGYRKLNTVPECYDNQVKELLTKIINDNQDKFVSLIRLRNIDFYKEINIERFEVINYFEDNFDTQNNKRYCGAEINFYTNF